MLDIYRDFVYNSHMNNANGAVEMKSWDELTELEQLQCTLHDLFKDVYGFRSYAAKPDTVEGCKAEMDRLVAQLEINERERKAEEAIAIQKFENLVASTISIGAANRAQAIEWIFQNEDEYTRHDKDYFCYNYGLPYGYFREAA